MLEEDVFLIILALVWIFVAVIQDFRKREIANWWNFSLIAMALAYRACVSVFLWDYNYVVWGIIGFSAFFILAYGFYYARVFAGGDAKLLMGLGAILPFSNELMENVELGLYFIILFLVCGSIYGLFYSLGLALKNNKKFGKELGKQFDKNKKLVKIFLVLAILVLLVVLIAREFMFIWFSLLVLIFPFLFIYAKSIEESCLIMEKKSKDLVLGDWLYREVKVGRKKVKPNWEGLSEEDLEILKKYRGKVLVKEGIPFTPSFLFAFIILIWIIQNNMLGWFYSLGI